MTIRTYRLLTDSTIPSTAKAGMLVYDCMCHDYGCASDDTRFTGIEHRSYTLKSDGGYPFFTHPVREVEAVNQ